MTAGDARRAGVGSGHPDLDTLAELQEGLLARDEQRRVRRHVATCAACSDALGTLEATQALLAALPPVTVPDDVAARLDAALAEVRTSEPAPVLGAATVVPAPARRRWWRSSGLASGAAAAAVVLFVTAVVANAALRAPHRHPATSPGATPAPTPSAAATFAATSSGRNYTAATLAADVPVLLGASAAAAPSAPNRTTDTGGQTSGSGPSLSARAPAPPAVPAPEALMRPQRLVDCVAALTGRPAGAVTPLAADLGSFQGKPAAVIVLPTANRPALVDVWVVGRGCNASDQEFIYFLRTTRPG